MFDRLHYSIPVTIDDSTSVLEKLMFLNKKLNDALENINIDLSEFLQYVDNGDKNTLEKTRHELFLKSNELQSAINTQNMTLTNLINSSSAELEQDLIKQTILLNQKIENLQIGFSTSVHSPITGTIQTIQATIDEMWYLLSVNWLTCQEYANLNATCEEYSNLNLSCMEYITRGRDAMWKYAHYFDTHLPQPVTGKWVTVYDVVRWLVSEHQNCLTVDEYVAKNLTCNGYSALDLTCENYNFDSKNLI